jgi:hypothetical protein
MVVEKEKVLGDYLKEPIWIIAILGVVIGYIGIRFDIFYMWLAGLILAMPLYVIVLPFCIFILLAFITSPLWLPLYKLLIRMHGAPFQCGDYVRILRGSHKNRVVRIYEIWLERDQVRVDLGENEEKNFTDLFSFLSIRKIQEREQASILNDRTTM